MTTVRIPRRFYEDHEWRDLPTPPAVRGTVHHVWIDPSHPDTTELANDAAYYAHEYGPEIEDSHGRNLQIAAKKTVQILNSNLETP